ncbi:MAG: NAD(P)H-binding protein [Edaphobacter sp.]|uniref:NAD(P)-dependent oxidoreductase n=1 Tax=Edaphobacter sp. TaxID=1934404 RepID=UPI002383AE07|nr:NAD(P)H-binding protein [Edaphobacter sp.]MDE1175866.1 NAD(P)H-binding protein [Edaphobacter sp.]
MRVTILGANGATGGLLTERSLAAGYEVTALVRRPAELRFKEKVRVVQGSVFEPEDVARALEGSEVVLSALGAHSPLRNENVLPRAIPVLVAVMREKGPGRVIALGSAGARGDSLKLQPAWRRWLVERVVYRTALKWPVHEQTVQYLRLSSSGLDWTMVMPPMLTNGRAKGSYRVDGEALPRNGGWISREDVAEFMMRQVEGREWVRKGVYLSY